jgi:hypothetical protein
LQHLHRFGGQQMLGAELHVRAVLALQQFPAIVGVQPATAARVEQMVGPRNPQQEMPGEVDPDQGNFQASGQFQRDQSQAPAVDRVGVPALYRATLLAAAKV